MRKLMGARGWPIWMAARRICLKDGLRENLLIGFGEMEKTAELNHSHS